MAKKQACPACGAMNSEKLYKCRLCGRVLEVTHDPTPVFRHQPRDLVTEKPKYGIGALVLPAAILFGFFVLALIGVGIIRNEYIDQAITIVQNQRASNVEGWVEVTPEGGNFQASFPGNQERLTQTEGALPELFTDGQIITGSFDDFDSVSVAWGTLSIPVSDSDIVTLERMAETYAKERNGFVQNFSFGLIQDKPTATFDIQYRGINTKYTKGLVSVQGQTGWIAIVDSSTDKFPLYETFREQYRYIS